MARRWSIIVVTAALVAAAAALAGGPPLTVDEVVKLVSNKISDNVVVAQIEETNSYFSLSTDDLIKLKQANASDYLVNYMITRKPGGPPNVGTKTNGGSSDGVNVRTAGREPLLEPPPVAETAAPPPAKFVDLTVNLGGKYVVTSGADLNVLYAAYIDGERKFYKDQWTRILTITTAETGASSKKWILEPGAFTVKVPAGTHALSLAVFSGASVLDDAAAKSHIVYTQQFTAAEGQPVVITLVGQTDEAGDRFVVTR